MRLLDFLCVFDWITPTIQTFDGKSDLHLVNTAGMTANDIKRILKQHRIKVGLGMWVNDELLLAVSNEKKARKIMAEYGAY